MNDMGIMVVQARDMIGIISWGYDWDMLAFLAILPQVLERVSRGFMTEFLGENCVRCRLSVFDWLLFARENHFTNQGAILGQTSNFVSYYLDLN